MKLYVSSNLVDIELLKELKSKFIVVFKDSRDVDIRFNGNILSYKDNEIDILEIANEKVSIGKAVNLIIDALQGQEELIRHGYIKDKRRDDE
jgi:hypothetical protein